MKDFYRAYMMKNIWFHILTVISVILLIISFLLPPTGTIDNSVLAATGELFAFAALATVIKAIDNGKTATIRKGDTELTVGDKENKEENIEG